MRKNSVSARVCASSFALAVVLVCPAHAQDNVRVGSANVNEIPDIIVTAQKVKNNVNDVGISINTLNSDQLTQNGITSPDQLTKAIPGLNVIKSGYGLPVYTMRGVGYFDAVAGASPTVSLYLDETPLQYPIMSRGLGLDVQRVEVLKGPQGTLFGQNATGGAINYIANRPTQNLSAGLDLGYSSYNRFQASGFVSGGLTRHLRARLSGMTDQGGGFQRSITRGDSLGDARFSAGRLLLEWTPSNRATITLNVNGWVDKSDEAASQLQGIATTARTNPAVIAAASAYPVPTNARMADWDVLPAGGFTDPFTGKTYNSLRRDDNFYQISLRGDFEVTDHIKLTSITSYDRLRQNTIIDADGTSSRIYLVTNLASIKAFSQELRLSGDSGPVEWVVGANLNRDDVRNNGDAFNTISTQPFQAAGTVADMKVISAAAFAHADIKLTDQFSLVAGIRYTKVDIDNRGCTLDAPDGNVGPGSLALIAQQAASRTFGMPVPLASDGGCITYDIVTHQPGMIYGKLNEHNVPFNVGINWKVTPDSLLYASVSRGYKAGNFSPNGAVFSTSIDPVKQERLLAYEAGFKLGLDDRHLQLNGAVFHYEYANKQVRGKIDGGPLGAVSKTFNVPKARINGAEAEVVFTPSSHFRIDLGGTYVDSKITDSFFAYNASGRAILDVSGEALPSTPKWQAQGDAEYNFPLGTSFNGLIGAHGQYQGKNNAGLGDEAVFNVPSYATLDLRAGVRAANESWSVIAFVNNVTDKYSWNSVNLSGPDALVRTPNPPRVFGVRASVRY